MSNRRWILAIMALAVILRVSAALYLGNDLRTAQQERIFDQVSYDALARSLLAGNGYTFDQDWYPFTPAHTPTAHWSFAYPVYLAGVYLISGAQPLAARLVQAVLCGILGTWLYYRLGRRLFGEAAGLLTAGLAAVYAYFIFHDAALMTESFYILTILAMLDISLMIVFDSPESGKTPTRLWLLLGVVLAAATLLRQAIMLWLPFLFLWLIWMLWGGGQKIRGARRAAARRAAALGWQLAIPVAVLALAILPWTIRNYQVYEAFLPLNSNAGYALYSANHPAHGTQFDQDLAAPLPQDLRGQGLNEAQWNSALTGKGLSFMLEDLPRYLLLSLDRVGIYFNFWFSAESSLTSDLMRVLSFGLYLPFMITGLVFSAQYWRKASLIYLFALVYSFMHILTWASIRYRLPVDAALMPFAALALVQLYERLRLRLPLPAGLRRETS